MPSENVEVIRAGFVLFRQEGLDGLAPMLDPEIEVFADPSFALNAGTFHGPDGFAKWSRQWFDAWKEIDYEPLDFLEVGEDIVIVPTLQTATGAGSGIEVQQEIVWLIQVREGRMRRFHLYADRETAIEVAERLSAVEETAHASE